MNNLAMRNIAFMVFNTDFVFAGPVTFQRSNPRAPSSGSTKRRVT